MIAQRKGPKSGSRAHEALQMLHHRGGQMDRLAWVNGVKWSGTLTQFDRQVVDSLRGFGLLEWTGHSFAITDKGRAFLGFPAAQASAVPTPPPYVAPMKPLSDHKRPIVRIVRPGAFDYRDIPSLYAGQRVPYRSSVTLQDEVQKG